MLTIRVVSGIDRKVRLQAFLLLVRSGTPSELTAASGSHVAFDFDITAFSKKPGVLEPHL